MHETNRQQVTATADFRLGTDQQAGIPLLFYGREPKLAAYNLFTEQTIVIAQIPSTPCRVPSFGCFIAKIACS